MGTVRNGTGQDEVAESVHSPDGGGFDDLSSDASVVDPVGGFSDESDADAGGDPDADADPGEGHELLELWSDREEVHVLPEILRPAEGLVVVGSGTVLRSGRLAQSRWLVVITDRRLLCIKGRQPVTRKVIEMPISAVRSVESKGLWQKMLVLETGYGTLRISGVKKAVAAEMVAGLTALMKSFRGEPAQATAIRRAELPGDGAGREGASTTAVLEVREIVNELQEEMRQLRGQVAFLEGLVRANVAAGPAESTE